MASFYEMTQIAANEQFKARVKYCLQKAAVAVMAEDPATVSHADRVTFAKAVLNGSASTAEAAMAAVTNATLTASGDIDASPLHGILDDPLEFTVNSLFNALAGVATSV